MDLGTIQTKLLSNHYSSINDVIKDIQLIVDNCKTFNEIYSPIVREARDMYKKMKKYCKFL